MKIFCLTGFLSGKTKKKWGRIMRLTLFLMVGFLLSASANSYSQNTRLDIKLKNGTIAEIIKHVEDNSEFVFLYKDEDLDLRKEITVNLEDATIDQVLSSALNEQNMEWDVYDRQIVLRKSISSGDSQKAGQQQRTITGTVTDQNGEPLPGVTVLVKGTTTGTVTNSDGNFSLTIPADAETLQFSFVGMRTQEVTVDGRTTFTVTMEEESIGIDEVVAIGYGTMKKSDLTGSVTSISSTELSNVPTVNIEQLMQGRAPGVQISSNTGMPGGGYTVRIRGVGTVNNNDPLYVIDGIPVFNDPSSIMSVSGSSEAQNPLALLNSDDIESVEILKDASAVAIYGARANNGVVMITTRRGNEGALRVNFETYHGFNKLVDNSDRMNSQEWAGWYASLLRSSGKENDANLPLLDQIASNPNAPTYDWVKEGTQLGIINNYQLSLTGGNKVSKYYTGANYYNEEGTIINSGLKRYSFRINTDHSLNNWMKVGNTLSITRSDQILGNTSLGNNAEMQRLMSIQPISPIYTDDGKYADPGPVADNLTHRIAALQNTKSTLLANRILGSLFADITIFEGLIFHTSWSVDQIFSTQESWSPPYEVDQGRASVLPENSSLSANNRNSFVWFNDDYFSYSTTINGKHAIDATLGYSAQLASLKNWNANVSNFISADYPYLSAGINQGNVGGGEIRNALVSYFARTNYIFDNRYLLTATVRRDGSSRFGENKRYGIFPAFSFGWRVSEETFMQNVPEISNLKFRLSWGKSGGQEIGNYSAFNILDTNFNYILGDQIVGGTAPLSLANPSLQWEATEQKNIGLNIGFFDNRLSLDADYFIKNTTNLLLRVKPSIEQGTIQNPFGNLGEIENRGFELGINTINFDNNFKWETNFNFTAIKNEVLSLANENEDRINDVDNAHFDAPTFITRVGHSIGEFYIHEVEGIFQSWDEIYSSPLQNTPVDAEGNPTLPQTNLSGQTAPGDLKFRDIKPDGVINEDDRTIVGNIIPDFTWGMTNTFQFEGVGLSVFIMGVQGVDVYNGARAARERFNQASNQMRSALNSWSINNPDTDIPRSVLTDPNRNNRASTRWLEDGSFVKIKNIRVFYNLPSSITEKLKISDLQIYANAVNALTFTKYTGFDPEIGNVNNNPEFGNMDAGQYPQSRQFLFGLKVGF